MELLVQSRVFKAGTVFPLRMALAAAGAALMLVGCNTSEALKTSETLSHGYVVDEETIAMVPVGSSREQVLLALGSPSTTATFGNEVLYYVSQTRQRRFAFSNPRVVSQSVLAVYLGEDGRVTNLANYGLQDGKVFDFISRTTPTGGAEQSFIGQLLTGVAGGGAPTSLPGF